MDLDLSDIEVFGNYLIMEEFKPIRAAILDFNGLMEPLYDCFEHASVLDVTSGNAHALILWNDILDDFRMMCAVANMKRIPTFLIQHGRGGMRDYLWEKDGKRVYFPTANAAFVWGNKDVEHALAGGWNKEQVFRSGAPWFAFRPEKKEEKGLVVFDAVHWDKEVEENYETWSELLKIDGIKPVAKLINGHNPEMFPGDKVFTDRTKLGHIRETYELLSRASAVVCMMEGTLELMAYSLDIPVIHVKHFKHTPLQGTYQGKEDTKPSEATIGCTLKDLPKALKLAIADPSLKRAERRKALLDYAGDPDTDTPIRTIATVIYDTIRRAKK